MVQGWLKDCLELTLLDEAWKVLNQNPDTASLPLVLIKAAISALLFI